MSRKISKTNKFLKVQNTQDVWAHFTESKEQSVIVKHLVEVCHKKILELWREIVTKLPRNISCFARQTLVLSLEQQFESVENSKPKHSFTYFRTVKFRCNRKDIHRGMIQ